MMMIWIVRLLVNGLALLIVDGLLESVEVDGFATAVIAAMILSIVNTVVRPILIMLTLPVTVLSLGLFLFVINGLTYWMASAIMPGFEVDGFWAAFFASIVTVIISWSLNGIVANLVLRR